jgi:outer membrane protein insertion porin family
MVGKSFTFASKYLFQTYSVSFSEPWFKKPVSFSSSLSYSKQFLNNFKHKERINKSFNILTLSVGLAKRLTVPDDFFVLSQSVSYQHYDLNNYNTGLPLGMEHQET